MNRRALLGVAAGTLGTTVGCVAPGQLRATGGTADGPIVEREFSLTDGGEPADGDWPSAMGAAVQFHRERRAVEIEGHLRSGYRACYETHLASAAYDADEDSLTVVVLDDRDESVENCPDVATVVPYRARIVFDRSLPGTVVVNHREDDGELVYEQTVTRDDETTSTTTD